MALLADIDDSYTRTGKGTLARWSSKLSMIPVVGGWLALPLGAVGTVIESAQFLFRGQFGNALTALVAGGVSTTVNTVAGFSDVLVKNVPGVFWWGNAASGLATGATLGTHARAATEALIGFVSRPLGMEPTVLRSHTAGIVGYGRSAMPQGPGKFMSDAARSKGEDPDAAYARMQAGQADHLAALESARAQGTSAYRGA